MKVNIDVSSDKKQYIEKDKLLLVENDEITKLQVTGGESHFRFNVMFEVICNLLEFKNKEKAIFWVLLYTKKEYTSFRQICLECAKYFGGNERSYHEFFQDMIRRGIIKTDYDNRVYVAKEYDLNNFNTEYLILKLN